MNPNNYPMQNFVPSRKWSSIFQKEIRKARNSKAVVPDGVQNEMFKLSPGLISEVLYTVWAIVGKIGEYLDDWKSSRLVPEFTKGDMSKPDSYRQL